MNKVRAAAAHLAGMDVYDPEFLPAEVHLSANENPHGIPDSVRFVMETRLQAVPLNRYPDPLANGMRERIAQAHGLEVDQILVGSGGDELLFDIALAWGGQRQKFLDVPPTFSVYENNARLTNTEIVTIPRFDDFSLDEEAILKRVSQGDIDYLILTNPNNPTGDLMDEAFIIQLLETTDALVVIDEAYFEFSGVTCVPLLREHKNLLVLRTLSKAYSIAGVRLGYVMADAAVIRELIKVRQPYSVNSLSQIIGECIFDQRDCFDGAIKEIIAQREILFEALKSISEVQVFPSTANYLLLKVRDARGIWQSLYDRGVLVRDFSATPFLQDCLRVSIGTAEENEKFLGALKSALAERKTHE